LQDSFRYIVNQMIGNSNEIPRLDDRDGLALGAPPRSVNSYGRYLTTTGPLCPPPSQAAGCAFGRRSPRYTLAEMWKWVNLANGLTLLRLVLAPFVVEAILSGRPWLAFVLFAVAAWTDILDGAAARRWHGSTRVGAYLDPVADKCLLSGVFLALAAVRRVPWWVVGVIFGRDLYILLAAVVLLQFTPLRSFPPSVWGKLSTFAQIVTVAVWMGRDLFQIEMLDVLSAAMLWVCVALAIWSGLHYTWRALRLVVLGGYIAGAR
jgi:cardiolipin synthase (CMP-forming)